MQLHATDCGAACLGIVLAYFGRWIPLQELREDCAVGRNGANAAEILRAAKRHGLEGKGWRKEPSQLSAMELPLILFWEFRHFVVLEGFDHNFYYLNDPDTGHRKLSAEEFSNGFSGIVLSFEPGPDFQRTSRPPGILTRLRPWLRGSGGAVAFVAACGMMLALLLLATPLLLGVFVDYVFAGGKQWGGLIAAVLAISALFVYVLTWLKLRCLRKLTLRLAIKNSVDCTSRTLQLPASFFHHRFAGDLVARIQSIDRIAAGISAHFLDLLVELGASTIFFIVMFAYDPAMALVVLALAGLNVGLMRAVTRLRVEENHKFLREQGLLLGVSMTGLQHLELLRSTGTDDNYFSRWGGHQARELAARQRFAELGHVNAAFPNFFLMLSNAAVIALGGMQVLSGQMTLGSLMGFYVVAGMFLAPVGRFVAFADQLQTLEADLDRLEDITRAPIDDTATRVGDDSSGRLKTAEGKLRLAGRVELRGVTFGYDRTLPPLIENLDLIVEPGQRIAFVGYSGSGKSTLAQIVAGVLQPWSGVVMFDDMPLADIPKEVMSASLSMVEQQEMLFATTVRENLTLWNHTISDEAIVAAAKDARIHDEIIRRPQGYGEMVGESGLNFSGGQRQRLEIARALVKSPSTIILDEATSALDAATEEKIDRALRRRGLTCVMVAHRLSTIRDCDRILVLDKGKVIQQGRHEQLMAEEEGLYAKLIRST